MFNRRFLRVKILQSLYAHFQGDNPSLSKSLGELNHSLERAFDLLLYLAMLPLELKHQGELRLEEAKKKVLPSQEDLNPKRKFVDNRLIAKLENSTQLKKWAESRSLSWGDQTESISRFYKKLRESDIYTDYMSSATDNYKKDRELIVNIYKTLLPNFDLFRHSFQEKSIYWDEEDFDYVSFLLVNLLNKVGAEKELDQYLKPVLDNPDDKAFVENLFKKSVSDSDELEKMIIGKVVNWDQDRIAFIDMILMKMAISEIRYFKMIPVKVSINEYVDIAKSFSSPKSAQFINGIVDKITMDLKEKGEIKKMGRGLLED